MSYSHVQVHSIYIAASSSEIERVLHWIEQLKTVGMRCTSTWIESIAKADGVANPRNATREARAGYSRENLVAIEEAQVVWFQLPKPENQTRGAWFEIGYAHALKKHFVVSGNDPAQSVFCALGTEFKDDLSAFAYLCRLYKEGYTS